MMAEFKISTHPIFLDNTIHAMLELLNAAKKAAIPAATQAKSMCVV